MDNKTKMVIVVKHYEGSTDGTVGDKVPEALASQTLAWPGRQAALNEIHGLDNMRSDRTDAEIAASYWCKHVDKIRGLCTDNVVAQLVPVEDVDKNFSLNIGGVQIAGQVKDETLLNKIAEIEQALIGMGEQQRDDIIKDIILLLYTEHLDD